MDLSLVAAQLKSTLEDASNGRPVKMDPEWIADFGREMEAAVTKQFTPRNPEFKIRMSNIGRDLCALQHQKMGTKAEPMPYNHIIRMLIGDSVEAIMRLMLKAAGVDVTSEGDQVQLEVAGHSISGESDLDIEGKVYDIKSCSPWAFKNKWSEGYSTLKKGDSFGYVGQLYGYADAQSKEPGGWIVVDKSSGEIQVVEVQDSRADVKEIRQDREDKVKALTSDTPFQKGFEPEDEYFRRKPTGDKVLHSSCRFCPFKKSCWPNAVLRPSKMSNPEAKSPAQKWFVE